MNAAPIELLGECPEHHDALLLDTHRVAYLRRQPAGRPLVEMAGTLIALPVMAAFVGVALLVAALVGLIGWWMDCPLPQGRVTPPAEPVHHPRSADTALYLVALVATVACAYLISAN